MTNTYQVTETEPQVLEALDDAELDAVAGGLIVVGSFGNSTFNAIGNYQGISLVSVGLLAIDL